jgi:5-formyltetrahydrofolate cyclo-ligase
MLAYDGLMTKAEARNFGRAARKRMAAEEQAELDGQIVARCQEGLAWDGVQRVHAFLPLRRLGEINTWPLVEWLREAHPEVQVWAPRLSTAGGMEAVLVGLETAFRDNRLGVPEPVTGEVLRSDEMVDLVLVPLLAFDRAGHRVGYGGGYYDRFLASQPGARKVGLGYAASEVPGGIAAETHDVRLDAVVTERGVLEFGYG